MWFKSKLLEQNENSCIEDCFHENSLIYYLNDFIELKINKKNYLKLIEMCDFLMVSNVDVLVDKIMVCFNYDYNKIHEFGDFYKLNSERLMPHTTETLKEAIKLHIWNPKKTYKKYGFVAYWDVSNMTTMEGMFHESQFNGDISQWNVSNVINMDGMFCNSEFDGDISKWDVSNVTSMESMFHDSEFNGDISLWDVSNVTNMEGMFCNSEFNQDISLWNVSNVVTMESMFYNSDFNCDISQWNISNATNTDNMFL